MGDQPLQNVHVAVGGGGIECRRRAALVAVEEEPAHHLVVGTPAEAMAEAEVTDGCLMCVAVTEGPAKGMKIKAA